MQYVYCINQNVIIFQYIMLLHDNAVLCVYMRALQAEIYLHATKYSLFIIHIVFTFSVCSSFLLPLFSFLAPTETLDGISRHCSSQLQQQHQPRHSINAIVRRTVNICHASLIAKRFVQEFYLPSIEADKRNSFLLCSISPDYKRNSHRVSETHPRCYGWIYSNR